MSLAEDDSVAKTDWAADISDISGALTKRGRPRKLDHEDENTLRSVHGLATINCTVREAAAFFEVSRATFENFLNRPGVREVWERGHDNFTISLRRFQYRHAENQASMAIFLGKNYLGQRDVSQHQWDLTGLTDEQLDILSVALGLISPAQLGFGRESAPPTLVGSGSTADKQPG